MNRQVERDISAISPGVSCALILLVKSLAIWAASIPFSTCLGEGPLYEKLAYRLAVEAPADACATCVRFVFEVWLNCA